MADKNISWIGLDQLREAVKRSPQRVLNETRSFISRGLAVYKRGIINSPWRMGGNGGGVPVSDDPRYNRKYQKQRSGNLRDSHMTEIDGLEGRIGPNLSAAPYAVYVHEGTGRMKARPWLDYVKKTSMGDIETLYRRMLENIISDLAS